MNRVASKILTEPLSLIHSNPFVHDYRLSSFEWWRTCTLGILMILIRLPLFLVLMLIACLLAKLFIIIISILDDHGYETEIIRTMGRWICFLIIRAAFFIVGFYWISYVDLRSDKDCIAPIIVVAPHTSFFDILVLMKLKNPTFVSKIENRDAFLIGNVVKLCQGIYVRRDDPNSRESTKKAIRDRALNGEHVLIFPEGTCHNRAALLEFKVGAFLPGLPVTPVIIRWDAGEVDGVTWTWEGPGPLHIFLYALTRISTNMEITVLPTYTPNEKEKCNAKLYTMNVETLMCSELGVLKWFYSFDDVTPFLTLRKFRQFSSPCSNLLLKLVNKLVDNPVILEKLETIKSDEEKDNAPKLEFETDWKADVMGSLLSIGEDVDHCKGLAEDVQYVPKHLKGVTQSALKRNSMKVSPLRNPNENLPISQTQRVHCRSLKDMPPVVKKLRSNEKILYEQFIYFIQYAIRMLEKNFIFRPIESSDDLIKLLDIDRYAQTVNVTSVLKLSPLIVQLLQILEHTVEGTPPTTYHLLAILHLSDLRTQDSWDNIRVVMRLLHLAREKVGPEKVTAGENANNPELILEDYRTLLWYVLGVQAFNDNYFDKSHFDFNYLRHNLQNQFTRAMIENAPDIFDSES